MGEKAYVSLYKHIKQPKVSIFPIYNEFSNMSQIEQKDLKVTQFYATIKIILSSVISTPDV